MERLRLSGVPLLTHPGRGGGVSLPPTRTTVAVEFDLPEAAALMSSLAVLGPDREPERRLGDGQARGRAGAVKVSG